MSASVRPRGFVPALWSLVTPPRFEPLAPTYGGLSFRPRPVGRGILPLADVYLPATPGPHRSIVLVHGGGFVIGSRRMKPMRYLSTHLCRAGFAVMVFDYRMAFRGGRLAESMDDIASAVRWWRAQAPQWDVDVDEVAMLGVSAGATLTLLHDAAAPEGAEVDRIVSIFGPTDFHTVGGLLGTLLRRLVVGDTDPERLRARSPISVCTRSTPLLLVHGGGDVMVPLEHARALERMRTARGLPVETLYFEDAPHAFLNDSRRPEAARTVDEVIRFVG